MQIIGHRGACAVAPENTFLSFDKALQDGAAGLEFDVQPCRDDLVVIHDATLDRTTNGMGRLVDYDFNDLQQLNAGQGARLQNLCAMLSRYAQGTRLFIEIKDRAIAKKVGDSVSALATKTPIGYQHCMVICFHPSVLHEVHRHHPQIRLGANVQSKKDYDILTRNEYVAENMSEILRDPWISCINIHHKCVNEGLVKQVQAAGKEIFAWTVNDPVQARQLQSWGINGIMTDNPGELR